MTFKEKVWELITVTHDDMTDDDVIKAILAAHNEECKARHEISCHMTFDVKLKEVSNG